MRAPAFWSVPYPTLRSQMLGPAASVWTWATRRRLGRGRPFDPGVPVICVGNATVGGTGKTPVTAALAEHFLKSGRAVGILSRGYGRRLEGTVRVDPVGHRADDVGDEPLLLARLAPTWVSADRRAGARAMVTAGIDLILMDDGFQNPDLLKRLSFLVIDGGVGLGNGCVVPAGPLREPWDEARLRAQAAIIVGDPVALLPDLGGLAVLSGRLVPTEPQRFAGRRVLAFAGIGRPEKFFATLRETGAEVVSTHPFPDHYPYGEGDLRRLLKTAQHAGAAPVTTFKDAARLGPFWRNQIEVLEVAFRFSEHRALDAVLARKGL